MSTSLLRIGVASLFLLLLIGPPKGFSQEKDLRLPIPNEAAQQKALELVRDVFKADFDKARTEKQKVVVAEKMIGTVPGDDAAAAYVVLRVARDIAAGAGAIQVATQAIIELEKRFKIDGVTMKLQVAIKVAATAQDNDDRKALAESASRLVDEALWNDRFTLANELAVAASSAARRAGESALSRELLAKAKQAEAIAKHYEKVKVAQALLEREPDDPSANETVGRYLCLMKGDWDKGVEYLVKCTESTLKKLATVDQAGAADATGQIALANGWWEFSEAQSGAAKQHAQRRAAFWYGKARPQLKGLLLAKIDKRLKSAPAPIRRADVVTASSPLAGDVEFRTVKTEHVGGGGNAPFEDLAPEGGYLVGFRSVILGTNVVAIQPVYRKGGRDIEGKPHGRLDPSRQRDAQLQQVIAKPGYAVGSMDLNAGAMIDSFRCVFMKVTDAGLDPNDSYNSPQVGGQGGGKRVLTGAGERIVGVYGYANAELRGIGLIVAVPTVDGWITIFRSSNPSLWDADHVEGDEMARSLKSMPEDIKFLRLTTLAKKPQSIIIPMQKDQLKKYWELGKYGWNGTGSKSWEGNHLGVFLNTRTDIRGTVHVGSHHQGWGFGHIHHGNEAAGGYTQGYSWQGLRIKPLVFEIAIKVGELTKAEANLLLR